MRGEFPVRHVISNLKLMGHRLMLSSWPGSAVEGRNQLQRNEMHQRLNRAVLDELKRFGQHTFGGNPLATQAACCCLNVARKYQVLK
jgi:hypothetical protein